MTPDRWTAVDRYVEQLLGLDDPVLADVLRASRDAGLPPIEVSPAQGRLLQLLVGLTGARRVLEIGTLGGYSTVLLARGLPPDGRVVTLEASRRHADVARANLDRAGVGDRVEVLVGPALDTLPGLAGPFDLVFVDADKENGAAYVREAVRLGRPSALVVVDNVVRGGRIADPADDDPRVVGSRAALELLATHPRLDATVLQTVGAKGWDGLALAVVRPAQHQAEQVGNVEPLPSYGTGEGRVLVDLVDRDALAAALDDVE